jgi:hypothetical protein
MPRGAPWGACVGLVLALGGLGAPVGGRLGWLTPCAAADPIPIPLTAVGHQYGLVVSAVYYNRSGPGSAGPVLSPSSSLLLLDVQSQVPGAVVVVPQSDGSLGSGSGSAVDNGGAASVPSVIVDGARTQMEGSRVVNASLSAAPVNDQGAACPGTLQSAVTATAWNSSQVLPVFYTPLQVCACVDVL